MRIWKCLLHLQSSEYLNLSQMYQFLQDRHRDILVFHGLTSMAWYSPWQIKLLAKWIKNLPLIGYNQL